MLLEARREFPRNPRLEVLQLFLLNDRSEQSARVLDQLTDSGLRRTETSPRAIYNRWPEGEAENLHLDYEEAATYKPLLLEALRKEGCL